MTMGWHTVMDFSPSLIGCIIARGNCSHALIKRSEPLRDQYSDG
jgi:flavin reductase (DIM6/NTAB) family NADH-FMN oxidoreductase RutF